MVFIVIVILMWVACMAVFNIIDSRGYNRPRNTIKPTDYATHWYRNYRKNDRGCSVDSTPATRPAGMDWSHIRHMEMRNAIREQTQAIREQTHAIRQEGASARHPENYMDRIVKGEW